MITIYSGSLLLKILSKIQNSLFKYLIYFTGYTHKTVHITHKSPKLITVSNTHGK